MFRRAMTRTTLTNALEEALRGEAETLLEGHFRLIAEKAACLAQVGPGVAHVRGALGQELLLDRAVEQGADRIGELEHACGAAGCDVQDGPAHAGGPRG